MASFKMHYAIEDAQIGAATVAMFAFRCGECLEDFHIDHRPNFCPKCGVEWETEEHFGVSAAEAKKGNG